MPYIKKEELEELKEKIEKLREDIRKLPLILD